MICDVLVFLTREEHEAYKKAYPSQFKYDYAVSREQKNAAGQKMPFGSDMLRRSSSASSFSSLSFSLAGCIELNLLLGYLTVSQSEIVLQGTFRPRWPSTQPLSTITHVMESVCGGDSGNLVGL